MGKEKKVVYKGNHLPLFPVEDPRELWLYPSLPPPLLLGAEAAIFAEENPPKNAQDLPPSPTQWVWRDQTFVPTLGGQPTTNPPSPSYKATPISDPPPSPPTLPRRDNWYSHPSLTERCGWVPHHTYPHPTPFSQKFLDREEKKKVPPF